MGADEEVVNGSSGAAPAPAGPAAAAAAAAGAPAAVDQAAGPRVRLLSFNVGMTGLRGIVKEHKTLGRFLDSLHAGGCWPAGGGC